MPVGEIIDDIDINSDNIVLAATHNYSGPDVFGTYSERDGSL